MKINKRLALVFIALIIVFGLLLFVNFSSRSKYKVIYGKDFNNTKYKFYKVKDLVEKDVYREGFKYSFKYPSSIKASILGFDETVFSDEYISFVYGEFNSEDFDKYLKDNYFSSSKNSVVLEKNISKDITSVISRYKMDDSDSYYETIALFHKYSNNSYFYVSYVLFDRRFSDSELDSLIDSFKVTKSDESNNICNLNDNNYLCKFDLGGTDYGNLSLSINSSKYKLDSNSDYILSFSTSNLKVRLLYDEIDVIEGYETSNIYDSNTTSSIVDSFDKEVYRYIAGKRYLIKISDKIGILLDGDNVNEEVIRDFLNYNLA